MPCYSPPEWAWVFQFLRRNGGLAG